MEFKKIICPCCEKKVNIPLNKYSTGFSYNYTILLNSTVEFFDLVDMCPECGYTMLFDNGISDEMREFVRSDSYRGILNDPYLEDGLKKWILVAMLTEFDENYTEAGIEYTKAYDYLELKGMPLDKRFIQKAAVCFLDAAGEYNSFPDGFLAVDALRRAGEFDTAKHYLQTLLETYEGELVDKVSWKEKIWLDVETKEKQFIEM